MSLYCAPQYGHTALPVASIGKYTRGCEFHRLIAGVGQLSGKSLRDTVYWRSALASCGDALATCGDALVVLGMGQPVSRSGAAIEIGRASCRARVCQDGWI